MSLPAFSPETNKILDKLFNTITIPLPGGVSFSPNLLQAGLIVILIFLLIYSLGHIRHTYVGWSIKGILPGITFGFLLAIIIEGLFLVGGKTLFTEIIGWKDAPKPISNVLDASRDKMVNVLGVTKDIPSLNAKDLTSSTLLRDYKLLSESEKNSFKKAVCSP